MNNYDWLIERLDAFIRKYYANQLLRGTLVLLIALIGFILVVSVGEYYLYMPVWLRVSLMSVFTLGVGAALIFWIIIPLSRMARIGKIISHEQAATIIGRHFPEVSDKLLNILQLKRQSDGYSSHDLIAASIDQKAAQISVVPITNAVNLARNKKYLPYLLPLLLIGVFILVAAPNVFKEASARMLHPTQTFEKPAPFRFIVTNTDLRAVRNTDYTIDLQMEGSTLPAEVYIAVGDDRLPMQTTGPNQYKYTFRNLTRPVSFRLFAAGFYSKEYTIEIIQKPVLKAFKIQLNYPAYTGRQDEVKTSMGDMVVPVGTSMNWALVTEHTDDASIRLGNGEPMALLKQGGIYAAQYRFMNDTGYTLVLKNKKANVTDSYSYHVKVIPDQYPVIQLQEFRDTVSGKQVLLNGTAGDDYGITKVLFHYEIVSAQNNPVVKKSIPLKITPGALAGFQHYFDVEVLKLSPGQKLNYFIEAWDNDGVHGSKPARSEMMSYQMFNPEQLDSAINENAQQINSGLSNSSNNTQKLQNEYREMQSKLLQSENMDWQQQQSVMDLMKMQEKLQDQMQAVKKRFEEQIQQSKQKEYSQDLRDKQEDLKKQMDNLLDKELQEQMKKLQDLMNKLNKEQAFQTMKQLEQDNKLFDMDLKRMQELMKKMEMQMRMEDLANKLDKLAEKQLDLKEQTEQQKKDNEALAAKQDELKSELDKAMKEDMKELDKANKDMKQDEQNLDKEKSEGEQAQQEMQQSKEQLGKKQNQKSSQSQNKAAQNLQSMANGLRSAAAGMDVEQIDIDIKATRQILTNLMRLSFDQEQLMKKVQVTPASSQVYITNQHEQSRLRNNSRMIRDSLFELSKRVAQLSATVNKETTELEKNIAASVNSLEARRIGDAVTRSQYSMTHTNNLALMLNELLSNLLQMQAQASQNQGSCNKPGGKTPKPGPGKQLSDIITEQQQLGNAMQQMKEAQQKRSQGKGQQQGKTGEGESQGGEQPGQKEGKNGSEGEYGDAEQLARMAQRQAAIRRQLQELNSLLNSKGMGAAKELKELQDKMDRTETDLVNKRFSNELVMRQKEILTRLLEVEKAVREQEQDDKRSSKSAEEISRAVPPELQKFMQERKQLLEQYKTVPPQLKPYYRLMVEQYYNNIGQGK